MAVLLLVAGRRLGRDGAAAVAAGAVVWAGVAACLAALLFLAPEYFQLARNLSGLRVGALLLALTLPAVAGWACGGLGSRAASPSRGPR